MAIEDLTKPARRISITLTLGQQRAIEGSFLFKLCGYSFSQWLRHAMITQITTDHSNDMERKVNETLALLKNMKK